MEDIPEYYEMAKKLFPSAYANYGEIVFSESVIDYYAMFRGVRYKDVPVRPYDLVFIDGPNYTLSDGPITFNFDFIKVVEQSGNPVVGLIDKRYTTCYVFENIFQEGRVSFDNLNGLGIVGLVTKKEFRPIIPWMRNHFNRYPLSDIFRLFHS